MKWTKSVLDDGIWEIKLKDYILKTSIGSYKCLILKNKSKYELK